MDVAEAAYLAGLMDGEGCFRIWKAPNKISPAGFQYRCCAEITMCDYDTIHFVSKIADRKMAKSRTLPSGRIAYKVIWYNHNAAAMIRAILPYLQGKKEQARLCLLFDDEVSPGKGRKMTPELMIEAEKLVHHIQALKKPNSSSLLIAQS